MISHHIKWQTESHLWNHNPMNTTPSNHQKHFVEVNNTHLSLGYIRENVLGLLGKITTAQKNISQLETRFTSCIIWVEFNIGTSPKESNKWRDFASCNSESAADAVINYFLHLRDACGIKRGKEKFKWDDWEMRFKKIS